MSLSLLGVITLRPADAIDGATEYTKSIKFENCSGDATVFLVSTAGSITVTQQCSLDNKTWYDPVNASNSAIGAVIATMGVTTGIYISFTVVLAPYIRFKIIEHGSAATTVTLKLIYRHER